MAPSGHMAAGAVDGPIRRAQWTNVALRFNAEFNVDVTHIEPVVDQHHLLDSSTLTAAKGYRNMFYSVCLTV